MTANVYCWGCRSLNKHFQNGLPEKYSFSDAARHAAETDHDMELRGVEIEVVEAGGAFAVRKTYARVPVVGDHLEITMYSYRVDRVLLQDGPCAARVTVQRSL